MSAAKEMVTITKNVAKGGKSRFMQLLEKNAMISHSPHPQTFEFVFKRNLGENFCSPGICVP